MNLQVFEKRHRLIASILLLLIDPLLLGKALTKALVFSFQTRNLSLHD